MLQNPKLWEKIYALRARAQEVCVEAQQARWKAEHIRYTAQLTRLARHMPGANTLTLALTSTLLRQRSLLADVTPHQPAPHHTPLTNSTSAPLGIGRALELPPDSMPRGAPPPTSPRSTSAWATAD